MAKETNGIGDGQRVQSKRLLQKMLKVWKQKHTECIIKVVIDGAEAKEETEVVIEAKVKVLAAAEAKVDFIIVTKRRQNEVILLLIKSIRRNLKLVVQAIRGRKNDDDPEAKTLLQNQ